MTATAFYSVLMVDDNAAMREALARSLTRRGCRVTTAVSAVEGLQVLKERSFDVVITDIEMPGMDGFDLASALRANPRTAELPIIGLSTMVSEEAIERGKRVGLHDYVAKFDRQGLIAALKEQTAGMSNAA